MKQTLIIHHKDDNDGIFSAAITQLALKDNYDTLGLDYNQVNILINGGEVAALTFEDILSNYEGVVLVDLSFPVPFMEKLLCTYGDRFIWNDHHAPIIAAIKSAGIKIQGIQDTTHSALYNCWKFFFSEREIPRMLYLLQLYDSWTFTPEEQEECAFVNSACNTLFKLNVNWVNHYLELLMNGKPEDVHTIAELVQIGRMISEEESRKDADMIHSRGDLSATVDGKPACFIVHGYPTGSRTFEYLKGSGIQHGVAIKRNPDTTWTIHLYNIEDDCDFHCGDYCRAHFNGGGHKGAAGGQISEERALELIKTLKF